MNSNKNKKKTILIDLDGVLNNYRGDFQENHIPEMRRGADKFLKHLSLSYRVKIFTTRPRLLVEHWIKSNNLFEYISDITNIKEPAYLIIDDRCIKFEGNYETILSSIPDFTPWYK